MEKVFISFGTWLAKKGVEKVYNFILDKTFEKNEINRLFKKALESTSNKLQSKYPEILGGSIDYFFSEEKILNELFKLLFNNAKIDFAIIESTLEVKTLPKDFVLEFIDTLKKEMNLSHTLNSILSNNELFVTVQGFNQELEQIAESSFLTVDELRRIRIVLENKFNSNFSYDDFYSAYRKVAINVLSQINFIGLEVEMSLQRGKKRKKLNDIFVKPYLKVNDAHFKLFEPIIEIRNSKKNTSENLHAISYSNLFSVFQNLVILGAPGAGKSTLIKSIICTILSNQINEFENKDVFSYLPFRIELRSYLNFKTGEKSGGLLDYILLLLEKEYSISNITKENLIQIFRDQKIIIFFDGLDEIFNVKDKLLIKNDIENIHEVYPQVHSITTSRIHGYEEAKLDEDNFFELQILNFDDDQIKEYVNKWYEKEEQDQEIRIREVNGFLNKRDQVDYELISNPLLLSLIVILYRNNLKLPESKLDIYQSCTKTLVDKWDSTKDLQIELMPELSLKKEILFSDLAHWQYVKLTMSEEISFESARKVIQSSIKTKLKEKDDVTSEKLSYQFMEYAQKRSLYFENIFTHKTFLEYFCANWIYSNYELKHKSKERNELIAKYIGNSSWFIVLELLLNMIDKNQADNEILNSIFEYQINASDESLPFLLNVLVDLKNVDREYCIFQAIDYLLSDKNDISLKDYAPSNLGVRIYTAINRLMRYNNYYRNVIFNYFNEHAVGSERIERRFYYYVCGLEDSLLLEETNPQIEEWIETIRFNANIKVVDNDPHLYLWINVWARSQDFILESYLIFVDKFGKSSFLGEWELPYEGWKRSSLASYFVRRSVDTDYESLASIIEKLETKGVAFEDIIRKGGQFSTYWESTEKIEKILNFLENSSYNKVNCLFVFLLCNNRFRRQSRNNNIFDDAIKNSKSQKYIHILTMSKEMTSSELINYLLKYFSI